MKTRAIIVDDEKQARISLAQDLSMHATSVEVIGEADSVKTAVALVKKHTPDLIFLDVELSDGNGFEVLEQLEGLDLKVIFVTAFDSFAVKAFKFSAVDYLLKPVIPAELVAALRKVELLNDREGIKASLKTLVENTRSVHNLDEKLVLHTSDGIHVVSIREIIKLESERNYTRLFFTKDKPLLVAKTLKAFEEMMKDHRFERTHQSFMVNLHQVKKYVNRDGGYLVMSDDSTVPVAQRKKTSVLALLSAR